MCSSSLIRILPTNDRLHQSKRDKYFWCCQAISATFASVPRGHTEKIVTWHRICKTEACACKEALIGKLKLLVVLYVCARVWKKSSFLFCLLCVYTKQCFEFSSLLSAVLFRDVWFWIVCMSLRITSLRINSCFESCLFE